MQIRSFVLLGALTVVPGLLRAQFDFRVAEKTVQVHSFVSQGFLYSNGNNYLSMKTSDGSFGMTDGGVNASVRLTDKFRIGAQFYDRNVGQFGNWHPQLDWAVADYRFKDWFGVRAGRVKTVLGLFNDTQDMEALHTWAILPQSAYPLDLRASTIAHNGGDIYGTVSLPHAGSIAYTGYFGTQTYDKWGGYGYGLAASNLGLSSIRSKQMGGDLRWNVFEGLLLGGSFLHGPTRADFTTEPIPGYVVNASFPGRTDTSAYYFEFKKSSVTVDGEYRRAVLSGDSKAGPLPATYLVQDSRSWYVSASWRISKLLEVGAYHSILYPLWDQDHAPAANHMADEVATAKLNLTRQWDFKLEGHFMDGYGTPLAFRGFYPQDNPDGLKPRTNMLVLRTGWTF